MQILLTSVRNKPPVRLSSMDTTGEASQHLEASIEYADLGHGDGLALITELCTDMGLYVDY